MRLELPHWREVAIKAEAEVESKKNTLDSIYAKTERLWQWARETLTGEVADQFWQISANGQLMKENPEYHQRINGLKYRAEKAEAEVERLTDLLDHYNAKCAICDCVNDVMELHAELTKLRKVVEAAGDVVGFGACHDENSFWSIKALQNTIENYEGWKKEGER